MIIRWEGGLGMGRFGNGGAQTTETWETRMRKGHQKTKQKDYQRNLQILNLEWQPTWLPCSRNQGTTITAVSVQAAVEPGTRPTCCARAKEELKDSPGSSSNGSAPAIGETMRGACRPCQRTKRNLPWLHLFGFHWLFGVYLCVVYIYIYAMVKTIWKTQDQRQIGDGLFHPVEGQSQFHTSRLTKWGLSRKKWFHLSKWYFPMTWNRYQHWSNGLTLLTTLITTTSNQYVSNTFYSHIIYLHITWLNMLI
jgi:hypothetical protein